MALNGELHVIADVPAAFADIVAEEFASRKNPDHFTLALSGGSTGRPCYEALLDTRIDWSKVTIIWGDERMVPPDDADSNYLLAKSAFLDKVGSFAAVHRMDSDAGAEAYGEILRPLLPIDVVHLGMGPDGHTASLFPGSDALDVTDKLVVMTGDDLHPHPRMTLTFAALQQTRVSLFTIMGAGKLDMFRKVQAGEDFPAAHVRSERVVWLADPAAVGV